MGTSVLYSSGDFGVAGFGNVCLDADGSYQQILPSYQNLLMDVFILMNVMGGVNR